jgi:hypothetical protein
MIVSYTVYISIDDNAELNGMRKNNSSNSQANITWTSLVYIRCIQANHIHLAPLATDNCKCAPAMSTPQFEEKSQRLGQMPYYVVWTQAQVVHGWLARRFASLTTIPDLYY